MDASTLLTDYSGSIGSAYFRCELQVMIPAGSRMSVQGSYAVQGEPGLDLLCEHE